MSASASSAYDKQSVQQALHSLAMSAASNITGVDFASVSVRRQDQTLDTVAATDALAIRLDTLQYELQEGPCYAAVTDERFVVVNDLAAPDGPYPRFGPRAVEAGVRAQTAIQLAHNGEQAGLNLYARVAGRVLLLHHAVGRAVSRARPRSCSATPVRSAAWAGTAEQTRHRHRGRHHDATLRSGPRPGFGFLFRLSQDRNIKLRTIAQQVIEGTCDPTAGCDELLGPGADIRPSRLSRLSKAQGIAGAAGAIEGPWAVGLRSARTCALGWFSKPPPPSRARDPVGRDPADDAPQQLPSGISVQRVLLDPSG